MEIYRVMDIFIRPDKVFQSDIGIGSTRNVKQFILTTFFDKEKINRDITFSI